MKILIGDDNTENIIKIDPDVMTVVLTEVFNGVTLGTSDGEVLFICMRDSGFEVRYMGGVNTFDISMNNGIVDVIKTTVVTPPKPLIPTITVNDDPSYDMFRKEK